MYLDFANVLVFSVVAIGFVFANIALIAKILRPKSTSEPSKLAIYECGEPTVGQAWIRFDIRFYTIALMFVVFDVEVALLFPWGVIFRDLVERGYGMIALIEAGTFIVILMFGLAYVWARGDIDWTPPASDFEGREGRQRTTDSAAATSSSVERAPVSSGAGGARG